MTPLGYDFLALKAFVNRGSVTGVGRKIGVGKESDVYEVIDGEGRQMALKLHRLGRTSFRDVKSKRDYLGKRTQYNWLYLSRLAAVKEYQFMVALHEYGFPVPEPIDANRHAVLMSVVRGKPLRQIRKPENTSEVYRECMQNICKLARHGLVHCDYNEFNLMLNHKNKLVIIDFPQMISINHANAEDFFCEMLNVCTNSSFVTGIIALKTIPWASQIPTLRLWWRKRVLTKPSTCSSARVDSRRSKSRSSKSTRLKCLKTVVQRVLNVT